MANGERTDADAAHDKRRQRGRDLTAAAGGLAAGGISHREALGNFIGEGESIVGAEADPAVPAGISETSLDVFDDLDPSAPMVQADVPTPYFELPSLTFAPEPAGSDAALAHGAVEAPDSAPQLPTIESSPLPDSDAGTPPSSFGDDESDDDDLDAGDALP